MIVHRLRFSPSPPRRTRRRSSTLGARFFRSDEVSKRRGLFFGFVVFGFCRHDVPPRRFRSRRGGYVFAVTRSNLPRWTSPSIELIRVCIFVATKMTRWFLLGFLSLYILVRSFGRCRVNLSRRIGRKDGGFLFPRRSPTAFW